MKRLALIFLFLACGLSGISQSVPFPPNQPAFGQIGPWGYNQNGTNWDTSPFQPFIYKGIPFRAMQPMNFNATRTEKYPLILFLHGAGESGGDNNRQLIHGGQFHRDAVQSGRFEGFLIYPQSFYGSWGGSLNAYLVEIINLYVRDRNVDPNKIYVHGLSGGGAGTWMMLQNYPKIFAAGLPMSNALLSIVPDMPNFKHVPVWYAQGGLDKKPPPSAGEAMRDEFIAVGGEIRYQFFPSLGHGTWNSMYAMPDFFEWMLAQSKLKIHVDGGRTNFCSGQTINVRMGVTGGFDGYQWMKDGVLMSATTNEIANNGAGSYQVRFRRGTVWTAWSQPVVLQFGAPSPTPVITANSGTTFPSLDGRTNVTLSGPDGKEFYRWSTGATTQSITVSAAGSYTLTSTDFNGCESLVSLPTVVTTTNGAGSPAVPANLVASSTSETTVDLTWAYSTSNHKKFELYRSTGSASGPYQLLGLLAPDVRNYSDGLLAANVNYFYQLRAVNDSGGSGYAAADAFTFKDVGVPTIPTELTVTSTSEKSISLSWKSSTDNINGLGSIVYDLMVNGQVREMNITNSNPFPNNLALARPGFASTSEGSTTQPSAGLDGNLNTYWSSALGALEAQDWLYVDLGETINLSSVNIRWTTDYAVGYKVQASNDAASWTDVRTVTGNATTVNNLTGLTGSGRYVRILATLRRAANRRVRVVEFQVYGSKPNGQDQAYIGAVLTGLTPKTTHNLSIRARDISGNVSNYTPQISALTVNDGLAYSYYEASITALSALSTYSPVKTGKVRNFDLTPRNRNSDIAFIYRGYINVPTNGLYTFYTTSVDGSNLYISDFLIVNNDGTHSSRERSGQIVLAPGTYPIRVEYFKRGSGTLLLEARYAGPGITKVLIPEASMNSDFAAPAAPAAPTGLVAAAASHKSIKVDWQYNSAVVASGFEIYRGSTPEGTFDLVATADGSARTFTDTNLTPLTAYYYRIRAVGPTGESALVKGEPTTPGITYKYYIGTFANLNTPYFGGIAATSSGSLANYSLSPATVPTNYGFQFDGFIVIPTTGSYTFYTRSDDGSRLFVGTTAVVANDFNQTMTERSGTISLTAGTYPITVLYRQGTSTTSGLEVRYQGPSIAKQLIPNASLKSITYVSATTQSIPPAPAVPTNLAAVPVNGKRVDLSWTLLPTTEGIKIFRSTTQASGYVQVGTATNATAFSDETVQSKITYYYKISGVNDGGESAQSGSVSVTTPNTAPTLEAVSNINLLIQTPSAIDINAADLDGDELNYTFTNLPAFATFEDFGDGYGNLNLNPGINDAGTYSNIILTVDDSFGGVARDTFQIYVNGNHTPILQTPIGNQSITAGKRIIMQLIATDGNAADVVTFSSQNLPPFVTLQNTTNGRATLTIAPPLAERGTYGDINILAEDGNGGAAIARFDITVKEAKTGYSVLVNFNDQWDTPAPSPWNNTQRYPSAGSVISNLQDTDLDNSEISLTLENGWAPNYTGPVTGDNSGIYPDVVTKTFYYIWDARVQSIKIGSLNPALKYSFKMLAATTNAAVGGPTRYTIGLQTAEVNPLNNTSNLATISDVTPDADGNVWLRIQTGAGAIYSYINALQIDASYVDGNPPAAPTNLVAEISEQQNSVDVTWKDNSPSETGFKVYRSLLPDSDFAEIGSLGVNAQEFEDVTISSNTTYYYQVIAINGYGNSQVSNTATVTTPIVAPVISATPDAVSVEATQSATVNITASDVSGLPVTITVTNLPSFVLFNNTGAGTANLVVLPTVNDLGHYVVTLTATNTQGASSSKDVILDITARQVRSTYVNFNVGYVQGAPWNNTNLAPLVNSTFGNLLDDQAVNTGISLRLNEAWSGVNSVGTVTGNNSGVFPDNVMKTFYYEQTASVKTILVSGLNPQKVYDFSFFASREGTGDRTTVFTIDTKSASINASNNTTQTADLNGIIAPTGQLTIQIQRGPSSSFAYLNALVIRSSNQTAVPVAPGNLVAKAKSKTSVELKWVDGSYNESGFEIYRSTLENPTFQYVATAPANASTYLDQGLTTNTQYSYKVRSINGDAPSPFSNIATVTTILNYVYINANSGYNVGQPWNNLNMTPVVGSRRSGLRDDTWTSTSIAFNVAAHPNGTTFGGANPFGKITGNNSGIYPDDVLRTFFFTEATEAARMVIDGLASNYSYNFVFFASRDGDGNRNTNYTIGSTTVTLNAAFNTSNTVQINAIKPDANGAVTIDMVSAPGAVYGYLNALVIEIYTDVPVVGGSSAKSKGSSLEENSLAAAYPNPFTYSSDPDKKLKVKILNPGESKSFKVNLVNQLGISVYENSFSIDGKSGSESLIHTIEDLKAPAGIYFVSVITDKNVRKVIKVIKED